MSRKNRSPEEQARRAKIRELLQSSDIKSMEDIQNLFKETIAEFIENGLDAELDDELGHSRYDYKNKNTNNSRNGHSSKTLRTSFGDTEISVPRDRKGEFEPQLLRKNQTSISQDIEEKCSMSVLSSSLLPTKASSRSLINPSLKVLFSKLGHVFPWGMINSLSPLFLQPQYSSFLLICSRQKTLSSFKSSFGNVVRFLIEKPIRRFSPSETPRICLPFESNSG